MSIFSFQPHPGDATHERMSMPTCVTMPNGVIAMFPNLKTAEHAYQEAYPSVGSDRNRGFCDQSLWLNPRVGALTSTRTMEYVDLNGAPWTIVLTSTDVGSIEKASATSQAYQSAAPTSTQAADTLEYDITEIDTYAKTHKRDSLEATNLRHYPQTAFKDSNDHEWTVEWITQKGKGHIGYFAFESDVVVGPAVSKTALKAMVEKYLTRLGDEKSTTESYAITSLAYGIDPARSMDVPPGVPSDGDASSTTNWRSIALFTGGFALLSCLAYFAWTNASI